MHLEFLLKTDAMLTGSAAVARPAQFPTSLYQQRHLPNATPIGAGDTERLAH